MAEFAELDVQFDTIPERDAAEEEDMEMATKHEEENYDKED
jgi:hypothetical protein